MFDQSTLETTAVLLGPKAMLPGEERLINRCRTFIQRQHYFHHHTLAVLPRVHMMSDHFWSERVSTHKAWSFRRPLITFFLLGLKRFTLARGTYA